MARYANKQNLITLVEALRQEYATPSWVKDAEELGSGLGIIDGTLTATMSEHSDGSTAGPIVELTAKGHAEQDTTTGKNLLPNMDMTRTVNGVTFTLNADGSVTASGTASITAVIDFGRYSLTLPAGVYTYSPATGSGYIQSVYEQGDSSASLIISGAGTFTLDHETSIFCRFGAAPNTTIDAKIYPQLELGSTATEYEPYTGGAPSPSPSFPQEIRVCNGHEVTGKTERYVDLVVKQGDTTLSTTPIPLPSRGWVGSLPDGTADVLTLDGAGKVTWELNDAKVVLNGSENWIDMSSRYGLAISGIKTWQNDGSPVDDEIVSDHFVRANNNSTYYGTQGIHRRMNGTNWIVVSRGISGGDTLDNFKSWLSTNPVIVLYPLATPVTEDAGYIEMPQVPVGAEISIPELDDLGVDYIIPLPVVLQGYEDRIAALEAAIAELATS